MMQYQLKDLVRLEHVILGLEAQDAREALDKMVSVLVTTGHVDQEYFKDVWEREQTFPTGLPTQPFATALPHADPDHVQQTSIAIATLKNPVKFAQMGADSSVVLNVRMIILLAIKERNKQVELIQQIAELLQSPPLLEKLLSLETPEEAVKVLHQAINSSQETSNH